jgi:ketosteroid isomerase-like protein
LCALASTARAQSPLSRSPAWARELVASDIASTTGGRATLAGVEFAVRVTIAPNEGGVARVIRVEGHGNETRMALRRFTGHPATGWWLWGPDTPYVRPLAPAQRATLERLARTALTIASVAGDIQTTCRGGSQAFVEIAFDLRATSVSRACLANDPVSQLATAMSDIAGSRDEEELRAAAVEELLDADRAFAAMAQRAGVPAAFAHYAADESFQFNPGAEPAQGRDAVARSWSDWPEGARLEWAPAYAQVSSRGDMGWTWGRSVTTRPDGSTRTARYLTVWRRNFDGDWRFVADIGVEGPPLPAPPLAAPPRRRN